MKLEAEAQQLLDQQLAELRARGYEGLEELLGEVTTSYFGGRLTVGTGGGPYTKQAVGVSGHKYHVEIDVDKDVFNANMLVTVEVSGGLDQEARASGGFAIAPDGTVVAD